MATRIEKVFLLTSVGVLCFVLSRVGFCDAGKYFGKYGLKNSARSMNFNVYASSKALATESVTKIESIYKKILTDLGGGMLRKKVFFLVWDEDKQQDYQTFLEEVNPEAPWARAFAMRNFRNYGPTIAAYKDSDLYSIVLPHELAHLVFSYFLSPLSRPQIPLWLNEGFARYQEQRDKTAERAMVRQAVADGSYIRLKELTGLQFYPSEEKVGLFYAESMVLVEFLFQKQGKRKGRFGSLANRLVNLKDDLSRAIQSSYYPEIRNFYDLEQQWLAYIKQMK